MADKKYIDPYKAFYGATVPNWLMERPEVSTGAKLCYARLCQFYGTDRKCERTQAEIAAKLAVGERQTRRYLDELARHALIEEEKIGFGGCCRYRFLDHAWVDFRAASSIRTETSALTVNPDISVLSIRTDKATLSIEKEKKNKGEIHVEAESVYQAYPRKVAKPAALKAITKAIRDLAGRTPPRDVAWLKGRVTAYAQTRVNEDPKFTPHPATWFNEHRFDDDELPGAGGQQAAPKNFSW
jgi:hypothetical protein